MRVRRDEIIGTPGMYYVYSSEFFNREIIMVQRNGLGFNIIGLDPGDVIPEIESRQVLSSSGYLFFRDPFTGPTVGRPNTRLLENVIVIYKT